MVHCIHLGEIRDPAPSSAACQECVRAGLRWVALRKCLSCGHVGCCDSSRGRHAREHFHASKHALIEPLKGEKWTWCYIDDAYVERDEPQPHA
jgi:uncharacterized UBP type Zn finger protein